MKNRYTILTIFALSLLVISCGNKKEKTTAINNGPTVAVTLNAINEENTNPFITASGKIEAANSANLSTRMMGFVKKIYVKVGDKVNKGQLLIAINNSDLQAKLAQVNASITEAAAAFNNAEKDYTRFKNLFADGSASQKEMDDITAHYTMAKARLEAAKQMKNEIQAQFAYVNIRAPFNGIVTNKFIKVGDMANPGMPLLSVETPKLFQVTAMVPESEISKIKTGTKVAVLVKSLNKTIAGEVTEVSTSAQNTGGQYLVKIVLNETNVPILSGMYATVQFPVEKTNTTSPMVLVSTEALVHNGELTGVYTVSQNNTAILRWLRLGRNFGDKVEVLSGLNADEKYIVKANGKLFNGVKVSIQ